MADSSVKDVIGKALTDEKFREDLTHNFDHALRTRGFQLSSDERAALSNVNWKTALPTGAAGAAATWVHIYKSQMA